LVSPLFFLPWRKGTGTGGTALKVHGQHGVVNVPLPLLASSARLAFPETQFETYIHLCRKNAFPFHAGEQVLRFVFPGFDLAGEFPAVRQRPGGQ
jgi:hypothetical protein